MVIKLALVTGATSGIGRALCHLLASKGIPLIATGRSMERLNELKTELSFIGFTGIVADLAIAAERATLIQLIYERAPDLVINNAGFGTYGEALTYSAEEQEKILEVNGKAVLELTLESARTLISKKQSGIILNVSSAAAFQIFPSLATYAATKAFVNHFSQSLDYEFRPHGVRVLVACPGMVETKFSQNAGGEKIDDKSSLVMHPNEVAELMWNQIENQRPLQVMNWKYTFLTLLTKLLPKSWLASKLSCDILARIKPRKIIKIKNDTRR